MTRVAGKKGKLAARFPSQLGKLSDYLVASLPEPPASTWGYGTTDTFPMADNDTIGDCTCAGWVHLAQIVASILDQPYTYPGDAAVESAYFGLTGGQDTGLDLATVITAGSKAGGFLGLEIVGAASIDIHDEALMAQAMWNFGALYVGAQVPSSVNEQFESDGYWHLTSPPSPIEGGHCVVLNGVSTIETSEGMKPDFRLVTWGAEIACTDNWWKYYGDECWALIPEGFVTANHDAVASLNLSQMQADLQALQAAK